MIYVYLYDDPLRMVRYDPASHVSRPCGFIATLASTTLLACQPQTTLHTIPALLYQIEVGDMRHMYAGCRMLQNPRS